MGHNRLGRLPKTWRWNEVIALLEIGGDLENIADSSFSAAENGLKKIPDDPGFIQTLTSIFKFLESFTTDRPQDSLWKNGFTVTNKPTSFDLISGFKSKVDNDLNAMKIKSDASEIAQNAFTEALSKTAFTGQETLFGSDPYDLQNSLKSYSSGNNLKSLMHEFYSSFTTRYLFYHLSREFPLHIGSGQRFAHIDGHREFNQAFDLHIRQTIRITDEFTPGWFGKTRYQGKISSDSVNKYAHVAFRKISGEFARGR